MSRFQRYSTHIAEDGAFIVSDRTRAASSRWLPTQFVCGQGGYDDRTRKFPDYVHAQLWALHECRQRAQFDKAQAARA